MHRIDTKIAIQASPAEVWGILTDFAAYPDWNPFIRSIEGVAEVGERLTILIQAPGGRAMRFAPRLLAIYLERELRWKGNLVIPGLFDGEHSLVLEPAPEGGVVFHHREAFSGLLVPLMKGPLAATQQGFAAMNEALKHRAENDAP